MPWPKVVASYARLRTCHVLLWTLGSGLSCALMELCASLKPRAGCLLVLCRNTCMVGLTSHGALVSEIQNPEPPTLSYRPFILELSVLRSQHWVQWLPALTGPSTFAPVTKGAWFGEESDFLSVMRDGGWVCHLCGPSAPEASVWAEPLPASCPHVHLRQFFLHSA